MKLLEGKTAIVTRSDTGVDACFFFWHFSTSKIVFLLLGAKSEPYKLAQQRASFGI